jgi:hypothetical protein
MYVTYTVRTQLLLRQQNALVAVGCCAKFLFHRCKSCHQGVFVLGFHSVIQLLVQAHEVAQLGHSCRHWVHLVDVVWQVVQQVGQLALVVVVDSVVTCT